MSLSTIRTVLNNKDRPENEKGAKGKKGLTKNGPAQSPQSSPLA